MIRTNFFIFIFLLFTSCIKNNIGTEFTVTVRPEEGKDFQATTNEDTDLEVIYTVSDQAKATELSLIIAEEPKFGKLKDCKLLNDLKMKCIYTPNKDFNGTDTILFKTKDGDFLSAKPSELKININSTPDKPIAQEGSEEKLVQNTPHVFNLRPGIDVDSDQLTYQIEKTPKHGVLSNCAGEVNPLHCNYKPNDGYSGDDSFSYRVVDETNLESEELTTVKLTIISPPLSGEHITVNVPKLIDSVNFQVPTARDNDSELNELKYIIKTKPKYGRLAL